MFLWRLKGHEKPFGLSEYATGLATRYFGPPGIFETRRDLKVELPEFLLRYLPLWTKSSLFTVASINCSLLLVRTFWSFVALRRNCLAIVLQAMEKHNTQLDLVDKTIIFRVCGENLLSKERIAWNGEAVINGTSVFAFFGLKIQ